MRVLAVALALLPLEAAALSCLPWFVEDAYLRAEQSADAYIILHGELLFDQTLTPKVDWDRQQDVPPVTRVPATLEGVALVPGSEQPFSGEVDVIVRCAGPWCAKLTSGKDHVLFARHADGAYEVEADPCSTMVFEAKDTSLMSRVRSCLAGKACVPATR